jgi:hypothetical protein
MLPKGRRTIGKKLPDFGGAVVAAFPQDLKFRGEENAGINRTITHLACVVLL